MARPPIAQVQDNQLLPLDRQGGDSPPLLVGSAAWFAWLAAPDHTSFAYAGLMGSFTARREQRRGRGYWYAYRRLAGQLHKAYLGLPDELTQARLATVAADLASGSSRAEAGHDAEPAPATAPPRSANTPQLLATKLFAPRPRADLVVRRRLLDRLDNGLINNRCMLISAPAGSGKTSLLAAWLATTASPTAWLSFDERDQDALLVLRYLITACRAIDPTCGRVAWGLLDQRPPPPADVALTHLLNDLATLPTPCRLVLDDYHLVRDRAVQTLIAFLLDHLPPPLRLVIATREDPPLPLPRLRARDELVEIRAADLRFSVDESATFLRDTMKLSLAAEQVVTLNERTEGWAAGLQLAGLALRDRADPASFVATFAGSHRLVAEYLTAETLDHLAAPTRRFLVTTSLLDRLCAPLCDALFAPDDDDPSRSSPTVADSQTTLEELERANLFLFPLDDERVWYRYHHLFADTLRTRLRREVGAAAVADLHRRASAWFDRAGLPAEAVQHALAAEDYPLAARLIEPLARPMQLRGEMTAVMGWLAALPEALLQGRPSLGLTYAWGLATVGQSAEAARWIDQIERDLTARGVDDKLLAEVAVTRTRMALVQGDYPRTIELARQALARLADDQILARALTYFALGSACIAVGDLATATPSFARSSDCYLQSGAHAEALLPLRQLARTQIAQGRLADAEQTIQRALQIAAARGLRSPIVGYIYVSLGELWYERDDRATAERAFNDGLALVELGGLSEALNLMNLTDAYLGLAQVRHARGDADGALDLLQQMESRWDHVTLAGRPRPPAPGPMAAAVALHRSGLVQLHVDRLVACRVQVWLSQGNYAAADQWARGRTWQPGATITFVQEVDCLTFARALMAQGETERPLAILAQVLANAEADGRLRRIVETVALQALAHQAADQFTAAMGALDRALALAEPEGFVRIFVDEGAPMAALLRAARAHSNSGAYIVKLLAAFAESGAGVPTALAPVTLGSAGVRAALPAPTGSPALPEPITKRELDVLRLLAAGRSNAEIAHDLIVEVNTIKTHLIHLYAKLSVHSRTQAVVRARELALLD